jgi:agmatinase
MKERNILYFTPTQIRKNIQLVKKKLSEFTKNSRVYVSIDIDVFDPSIAPAVEYPEPNGLFFHEFVELIEAFEGKLVGMDLNCQKFLPNNQITEFLATRAVFEVLNLLQK